jgi:purine-binding chemotaxis protein CheW
VGEEIEKRKSDRILEAIKKRLDEKQTIQVEEKKVELVVFTLNDAFYAFYGKDVKEILSVLTIYFVPGTPKYILGIINVRGDIQSVLNIRTFLNIPEKELNDGKGRIVIAEKNGVRSGVLVDSVVDVVEVPEESIKEAISTLNEEIRYFVVGETTYKNNNVVLLDIGKVFEKISEGKIESSTEIPNK